MRLLQTNWYRLNGRFDQPAVIPLRFNQPVRPADVAAHVTVQYQAHDWPQPGLTADQRARMGADAARFDAKLAATLAIVNSTAPVTVHLAADWDKKRFPAASDLVVLQTDAPPASDGWLRITIDNRIPAVEGAAAPANAQSYTVQLEPTLFVDTFRCGVACDADRYNSARLRSETVALDALVAATTVRDVTRGGQGVPVAHAATPRETPAFRLENIAYFTLEDLGFDRQPPSSTYAVTIDSTLRAADGQTLGYAWTGVVENWHDRAFTSFGDGHGVWETGGGPAAVLRAQFRRCLAVGPRIDARSPDADHPRPQGPQLPCDPRRRRRSSHARRRGRQGPVARPRRVGGRCLLPAPACVWAAVKRGEPIARARPLDAAADTVASVVQVTNLGITVKDSPQNTLVFVTRLDTGAPVAGANVSIVRLDNRSPGPAGPTRTASPWRRSSSCAIRADGGSSTSSSPRRKTATSRTSAATGTKASSPRNSACRFDLAEAQPLLRGTVFTDRGVYKLGEEVHVKAILRRDTPTGIQLIPDGTPVYIAVKDSRDKVVDRRTVMMNAWSTTEWTFTPAGGRRARQLPGARRAGQDGARRARAQASPGRSTLTNRQPQRKIVRGGFLVAAYRRPDFRVDATLDGRRRRWPAPARRASSTRVICSARRWPSGR